MVARNDITGDAIQTKGVTEAFRDNYDLIFRKNKTDKNDNTGTNKDSFQDILSTEDAIIDTVEKEKK
jgi:hypothetical protein